MFQGLIIELQRKTNKKEKFDEETYNEIKHTDKLLENFIHELSLLNEQLEYTKEIVNSLRIAQELFDGFNEK